MITQLVEEKIAIGLKNFEDELLLKYKKSIYPYSSLFENLNCHLRIELGWNNCFKNTGASKRLSMENGYECYVFCIVEKDGKEVQIKSFDGEVDYYPLIASWKISSVSRKFFKLKVTTYEKLNDIDDEMNSMLSKLQHL